MNQNKIIFLTEDIFGDSIGGVEQHIYHIATQLASSGKHVVIVSLKIGKINSRTSDTIFKAAGSVTVVRLVRRNILIFPLQILEKYISGGGGLVVGFLGKLLPNFHWKTLIIEVEKNSPDFIHQHDYLANIVASKLLARKMPVFFTNHTGQYLFLEKFYLTQRFQKWLIGHYTAIMGPSLELTPSHPRASYIPNGVDVDFFSPEGAMKDPNRLVLICPRRWAPTKGVIYLARAMALLSPRYQERLTVLFAGSDSDDYPWYRDQVLEVLSRVPSNAYKLLGNLNQEELKSSFSIADVVVIPSLMEATSLAAMEGMACGLPVLSSNVGGMPDVVEPGRTGWLVPSEDPNALADVIVEIIDGKYDVSLMGERASHFVREHRSWKEIAGRVEKVYERHFAKLEG